MSQSSQHFEMVSAVAFLISMLLYLYPAVRETVPMSKINLYFLVSSAAIVGESLVWYFRLPWVGLSICVVLIVGFVCVTHGSRSARDTQNIQE